MKKVVLYRLVLLLVLSMASLLVMGCGDNTTTGNAASTTAPAGKLTVTDLAGKTVTLKKDIQRIVLLRGRDVYELSALLGDELPSKIVAWGPDIKTADKDGYDKFVEKYPALKNMPETGDIFADAVNPEQILAFKPDLVVMDIFMIERGFKSVGKLQEIGLPLLFLDQSGDPLGSPQKSMTLLGKVLGKEERAQEIVKYADAQIETVVSRLNKLTIPKPSVYLESGDQGPAKFGSTYGSYGTPKKFSSWGEILNRLQVTNIAEGIISNMSQINPEMVLKANPDIIIITGQNWTGSNSMRLGYFADATTSKILLDGFLNRPGWQTLSAVKNKRVYSIFHNFSMHIFDFAGLQALAKVCYPEDFKDLDPAKNLKEFHDKYLPISFSGVWLLGGSNG